MATSTVRIRGLKETQRALRKVNKDAAKAIDRELKQAAEPMRATAEQLAFTQIGNIGPQWGRIRLGGRTGMVFIAPKTRPTGAGSSRPNLAPLLLERAMLPALDQHRENLIDRVDDALDRVTLSAGF